MKETRYTVIGAGHGGKAMAADLAVKGFTVRLYNRTAERINEIALRGEIELEYEDGTHHLSRLAVVTSDIAEALDGTDVIMVVVPASGHGPSMPWFGWPAWSTEPTTMNGGARLRTWG